MRIAAAFLVLLVAGCGGSPSLQKQAEDLQSVAAEGALLAHDAADGETTGPFTIIHSRALRETAAKLERSARSARLAFLAASISNSLERLEDAPQDRTVASAVERRLDDAANAAERLARGA